MSSDLGKWQTISFVSRMLSKMIGMIPSILIPRMLSVSEFGLVGIAKSLGKTFGVTQNLGLASGSTREISNVNNTKEDIFKIFVTSVAIKYALSLPLALALFLLADRLATQYNNAALAIPLKIYSLVLIVQNIQSLFNSVVQGMQRFKLLFSYQVLITIPNVILFVSLVYLYGVNGYFYASLIFNLFASIVLGFLALWPLRHDFVMPSKAEFIKIGKVVFVVSLAVYVAKIIYTLWEGIGPLILGRTLTAEQVGYFVFAALYAGQLMAISDSVTDVNLSVFSKQYSIDSQTFKDIFMANFNKIFVLVLFIASSAVYWSYEVTTLFYGDKYLQSLVLIPPILTAFVFYSYVNIAKSSIFVPAKMMKDLMMSYGMLLVGTLCAYFGLRLFFGPMESMALGMAFGAVAAYMLMNAFTQVRLKFLLFDFKHMLVVFAAAALVLSANLLNTKVLTALSDPSTFAINVGIYLALCLGFYLVSYYLGFFDIRSLTIWSKVRK